MEEIIGSCTLYLLYKIQISTHISLPVAGLIWSWMSQRMAVPEARSSPVHSAQSWPAPQHYNCQWWPGSGSGVLRLLPSKSSQSQAAAQISWDTIFGGVTPLGGDGGHGRSREWQAGARQGIIISYTLMILFFCVKSLLEVGLLVVLVNYCFKIGKSKFQIRVLHLSLLVNNSIPTKWYTGSRQNSYRQKYKSVQFKFTFAVLVEWLYF